VDPPDPPVVVDAPALLPALSEPAAPPLPLSPPDELTPDWVGPPVQADMPRSNPTNPVTAIRFIGDNLSAEPWNRPVKDGTVRMHPKETPGKKPSCVSV
jgi:hypothetical protein